MYANFKLCGTIAVALLLGQHAPAAPAQKPGSTNDAALIQKYLAGANQGSVDAMFNLGVMHTEGRGTTRDEARAAQWFNAAAERGHVQAMFNLGAMYSSGRGVQRDPVLAVEWYQKAAAGGSVEAIASLGWAFEHGEGVVADPAAAFAYYTRALEKGNRDVALHLGSLCERGLGVRRDEERAILYYEIAAREGDATAMYNLGVMHSEGRGTPRDGHAARTWFQRAIDKGNTRAMFNLAVIKAKGEVGNMDRELLLPVVRAHPDWARPHFFLALSYHKEQRYAEARKLYERVIELEPDYVPVRMPYGRCLYYLGELEKARGMIEEFIKTRPDYADAHFALGIIDFDEDALDSAEQRFRRAVELGQAQQDLTMQTKCLAWLGDVYMRRGDMESARTELEASIALDPNNAEVYFKLSRVMQRLGDESRAEWARLKADEIRARSRPGQSPEDQQPGG